MKNITQMIMKAVALGMGVAVVVLSTLNTIDANSGMLMLGIGLACLAISTFPQKGEK